MSNQKAGFWNLNWFLCTNMMRKTWLLKLTILYDLSIEIKPVLPLLNLLTYDDVNGGNIWMVPKILQFIISAECRTRVKVCIRSFSSYLAGHTIAGHLFSDHIFFLKKIWRKIENSAWQNRNVEFCLKFLVEKIYDLILNNL